MEKVKNFQALTGIRGVAAIWVVFFHTFFGENIPIIKDGYAGVDLFFLLSGFILTHVYIKNTSIMNIRHYFRFIGVRLARIYPLHIFALFFMAALIFTLPGFENPYRNAKVMFGTHAFLANIFLIQNWGSAYAGSWDGPSWSLSAEWFAYIFFPFALIQINKIQSKNVLIALGVLCIFSTIGALFLAGYHDTSPIGLAGMARLAGEFPAGCFFYVAILRGWRLPDISILLMIFFVLILTLPIKYFEFLCVFCFAFLVVVSSQENSLASRFLRQKIFLFLGDISFSLYLIHWPVIQFFDYMIRNGLKLDTPERLFAIILTSLAISTASFRYIERPARAWGRRLAGSVKAIPLRQGSSAA